MGFTGYLLFWRRRVGFVFFFEDGGGGCIYMFVFGVVFIFNVEVYIVSVVLVLFFVI